MELGLRALVAAGAQSVMTLHSCRYFTFTPEIGTDGKLANATAFEEYLQSVRTEGTHMLVCLREWLHQEWLAYRNTPSLHADRSTFVHAADGIAVFDFAASLCWCHGSLRLMLLYC